MAATIHSETGLDAELVGGSLGQFDVELDGKVIASKKGALLTSPASGGWPDPQRVIEEIERRQAKSK